MLWISTTFLPVESLASALVKNKVSYFKGAPEEISLQALSQLEFTPIGNRFALGYSDQPIWMRVDIERSNYNEALTFSLWPPRFQNIPVYLQTAKGFTRIDPSDDYNLSTDNLFNSFHDNIYKIDASDSNHVLFFRLQSKWSIIGNIDIYPERAINNQSANQGFLLGGIFFGLIPFILVLILFSIYTKLPIYTFYCISLISNAVVFLGSAGFDFQGFIPYFSKSLDEQVAFLTLINPLTAYLFMTYVADLLNAPKAHTYRLRVCIYALILLSPSYFLFDSSLLSKSYMLSNFVLSGVVIFLISSYFDRKNPIEWACAVLFVCMNLLGLRVFASLLGFIQIDTSIFTAQSFRIVAVPLVLALLVAYYENKNRKVLIELEIKSELAEKKELIENERRRTYERFITMIVHEIKTPLSTIQIAAASLQRHLSENTLELKRITHIQESVVDINQVFNKCLQVVDIENGAVMIQTSAFGIPVLIEDLKRVLNSQRIVYEVQTSQKINTDYVILKTILLNLLSNAIKYAKPDTTIVFTIEEMNATDGKIQLLFKVRNEIGPIGPPDPDLTFTRHYRSESAKKHAGTGLGLWLSKELAASINASIHLSNSDTETCFDVYLNID